MAVEKGERLLSMLFLLCGKDGATIDDEESVLLVV